ncbi:MAG: hypothetical protein CMK09_13900 [Ponticaulis sp.]|nr:hypothetical protein [Ponticaulis sp.]|tara:strand:+ start:19372 stop:19713 length:342 start_codon:yes stop_codon:yes gene_type:complete
MTYLLAAGCLAACTPFDPDSAAPDQTIETSTESKTALISLINHPLAASCSGCHTPSAESAIPSLSDRSSEDLFDAFMLYKTEADGTTVMHRIARGYSEADIAEISDYLAEMSE